MIWTKSTRWRLNLNEHLIKYTGLFDSYNSIYLGLHLQHFFHYWKERRLPWMTKTNCWKGMHKHLLVKVIIMKLWFYLRQPVVLRRTKEVWNLILWSSSKEELFHPEWGTITLFVNVARASRMIVIFTASHEDRFQRTPLE